MSCLNVYYNDMSMYAYCFNCVTFTDALLKIVLLFKKEAIVYLQSTEL